VYRSLSHSFLRAVLVLKWPNVHTSQYKWTVHKTGSSELGTRNTLPLPTWLNIVWLKLWSLCLELFSHLSDSTIMSLILQIGLLHYMCAQ
jgi:hypothetical protein